MHGTQPLPFCSPLSAALPSPVQQWEGGAHSWVGERPGQGLVRCQSNDPRQGGREVSLQSPYSLLSQGNASRFCYGGESSSSVGLRIPEGKGCVCLAR